MLTLRHALWILLTSCLLVYGCSTAKDVRKTHRTASRTVLVSWKAHEGHGQTGVPDSWREIKVFRRLSKMIDTQQLLEALLSY